MSNRLFQGIIHQMKGAVDRVIGVIDENGVIISCSDFVKIGEIRQGVRDELAYLDGCLVSDGYTYRPIDGAAKIEYVVFVQGEDDRAEEISSILAVALNQIKNLYDEKYDVQRVAILIKFLGRSDIVPFDVIQSMFPDKSRDYVIIVNEFDVVLIKELAQNDDIKGVEKLAKQIADTVSSEFYTKVAIGIGTAVSTIKDLAKSYKEAQIAIEVGKVFDTEKNIISYENLGIGRLIYQLPTTLCEMFLQEVFKKGSLESLDAETLMTIQCFFENNLNVSETSRKLFVHRNTLVYRLEKIRKLTGLDLREFEHAITFKVALMVKKYLSSKPAKY